METELDEHKNGAQARRGSVQAELREAHERRHEEAIGHSEDPARGACRDEWRSEAGEANCPIAIAPRSDEEAPGTGKQEPKRHNVDQGESGESAHQAQA
jgi:hypothetical protein